MSILSVFTRFVLCLPRADKVFALRLLASECAILDWTWSDCALLRLLCAESAPTLGVAVEVRHRSRFVAAKERN